MKYKKYSSEAIVLSRKNYGEADRILTIYSKHYGKLDLLAKGVRKPKSRKRGHIEIFNNISFSATSGHGLPIITEAEIILSYQKIRNNLKKVAVAYYLVEVLKRLTQEGEMNQRLYDLTLIYFQNLGTPNIKLKKLRHEFIKESLVLLGFWPIGKDMINPDQLLEEIAERKLNSYRVGKKLLQ